MAIGSAARAARSVKDSRRPTSADGRMTLTEHLREFRRRILIAAASIVVGMAVAFVFHHELFHLITGPYRALPPKYGVLPGNPLVFTGITEGFTVTLKVCFYAGLIGSSPVWLWQLWGFITPGLYRHERRYATLFVGASVLLFCMGGFFAWIALHQALRFLLGFATGSGVAALPTFATYLSFVIAMVLVFAVSFEFPLVIVMLNLVGILSYARLKKWTRGIIFGIFAFAGTATPSGDPISMLVLAVPMTLLFGVAMFIARLHDRRVASRVSPYANLNDDDTSPLDAEDFDPDNDPAGVK